MTPPPPRSAVRHRGFTLLELLIVILIVGLLAALLTSVVLSALGMADVVRCQNRLRHVGRAYRQYMDAERGVWPPLLTPERPAEALLRQIEAETGLAAAPARPHPDWGQPGPHWSIVLYPYLGDLRLCTCPADPKAGRRGTAVIAPAAAHAVGLLDAPPESYALNVVLFRTQDGLRRQAGCAWGTAGEVDFNGLQTCTTEPEQRRLFPCLDRRVLFFCGASGMTVGSQFNVPFRDRPGLAGCERWEWHPRRASLPFADEPDCGANYLFHGGHVEYRKTLPSRWEWAYELGPAPASP